MGFKPFDALMEKVKLKIPLSFGEAREVLTRKIKQNKETLEAHKRKEFPIHYTSNDDVAKQDQGRREYLQYVMFLIQEEKPIYHRILAARMSGLSVKRIAREMTKRLGYDVSIAEVSKREKEAIEYVKGKIEHLKRTGIPIFEGQHSNPGHALI